MADSSGAAAGANVTVNDNSAPTGEEKKEEKVSTTTPSLSAGKVDAAEIEEVRPHICDFPSSSPRSNPLCIYTYILTC